MEFESFDGGNDGEYTGDGFVEISKNSQDAYTGWIVVWKN